MPSSAWGWRTAATKAVLDAAAEGTHAVGARRRRGEAETGGACVVVSWKARTASSAIVPFFILHGEEELHEICADGEVGCVAGDDEGLEVGDLVARWLEGLGDEGEDVVAERVHLRVQLDGGDSVAEVDDGCARVLADDAVGPS